MKKKMRKIILCIAASLDQRIAEPDGGMAYRIPKSKKGRLRL
jgi:hypothetical protein